MREKELMMFEFSENKSNPPVPKWNAAERAYDLNLVAELKHGKLPDLEAELEKLENAEKKMIPFLRKK